ncbi:MAG TPA: hypothetical protein VNW52_08505, partial [Burkholderiaceae bacterium]|nr:hypothetical protein [Burkholderiaceae bacterium]
MMNASRLKVLPEYTSKIGYFWMFLLAIYWGALLLSSPTHNVNAGVDVLILLNGLGLAVSGWCGGRALADGGRVLSPLQTPRTLWREWLQTTLKGIGIQWVVAVLAGMLALIVSDAEWTWSSATCLFSTLMLLGMIASLSHFGVWHWAWPWCITLTLCLLFALVGLHGLNQFMQESSLWQLPIALGWPLLLAGLAWHWRDHPPKEVAVRGRMQFNPLRRAMNYIKRYAALGYATQRSAQFKNKGSAQVFSNTFLPIYSLIFLGDRLHAH